VSPRPQTALPAGGDRIEYRAPNPKSAGTLCAARYDRYMEATTVSEALRLGATKKDVRYDFSKGFLQWLDESPSLCLVCGAPTTCADDLSGISPHLGGENAGHVVVKYVTTKAQLADILTKSLATNDLDDACEKLFA
jgi:hypothetical protein